MEAPSNRLLTAYICMGHEVYYYWWLLYVVTSDPLRAESVLQNKSLVCANTTLCKLHKVSKGLSTGVLKKVLTRLCSKKTKWWTELPEGFACPIPVQWVRFLRRGEGSFQVIWRTDLEVDLERTHNYCVELLSLYLRRMII